MQVDDSSAVAESTEETTRSHRRQLTQQAVTLAMQSRWQEAGDVNREIVEAWPDDVEAYNRLGKALTELGHIDEARQAYEKAIEADAANLIAQRNLERLSKISESEATELAKKAGQKLDPQFFMEETGKTGVIILEDADQSEALATLTAGDEVKLTVGDGQLRVTTTAGAVVGRVGDYLTTRLTRLMKTGNEYRAGIVGIDDHTVRVIIRETLQAPENNGKISFPPKTTQEGLPRPYVREGLLKRAGDEEEEDELVADEEAEGDEEEEDTAEFGFHEGPLEET